MPDHATPLITLLAAGLGLAFVFGMLAHRLGVQPLVGYLVAGIAVGPYTPGFVGDPALAVELSELGVILLMFGVGLHFSLKDLASVAAIAVPGALVQILAATGLGAALAWALGWDIGPGIVLGLALSVASTVVLVRALQDRHILQTDRGRIAVGWLVVEDLAMVLALVLLPAIATALASGNLTPAAIGISVAVTFAKVGAFVAVMLVAGRRILPWLMHLTAHTGSRELFRLVVYASAVGIAFGAAKVFGASFALGAFFAGMVMGESKLSQRATEEAMPLRDAFAVLFFVSVGMLFDFTVLVEQPLAVAGVVGVIVVGKSLAAYAILRAFGHGNGVALTVSASLAQIGEFSFILGALGTELGLLPPEGRDLILAGAILSILVNPVLFAFAERRVARAPAAPPPPTRAPTLLHDHDVLIGFGRVGGPVGAGLHAAGRPVFVIEEGVAGVAAARDLGLDAVEGNAAEPRVLATAGIPRARRLFVTIPEAFEAGQVIQQARALNPAIVIVARAHSDAGLAHLEGLGAGLVVSGEREIAARMLAHAGAAAT